MVFAHVLGIPVEETALAFAPVIVLITVGVRVYARQTREKLRVSQRGIGKTDT
jgi:hypothetical protein